MILIHPTCNLYTTMHSMILTCLFSLIIVLALKRIINIHSFIWIADKNSYKKRQCTSVLKLLKGWPVQAVTCNVIQKLIRDTFGSQGWQNLLAQTRFLFLFLYQVDKKQTKGNWKPTIQKNFLKFVFFKFKNPRWPPKSSQLFKIQASWSGFQMVNARWWPFWSVFKW